MSRGDSQTKRGHAAIPNGPAYNRSGTKGTGNEPQRQTDSKLTTAFPHVNETRSRKQGSPGKEADGQQDRGWGVVEGGSQKTDDATVSADGRRRVKHIGSD